MAVSFNSSRKSTRRSQRQRILDRLLAERGGWVSALELAGISLQYSARVRELRLLGFGVENRVAIIDGQRHGSFRLPLGPLRATDLSESEKPTSTTGFQQRQPALFDMADPAGAIGL